MSQFFVSKGQAVKGPHLNVTRSASATGKLLRSGTPGGFYTSDEFNMTPLPAEFVEFAQAKVEKNGKTVLENMLAAGLLVTEAGGMTPVKFAPAIGSELTVSTRSGRITEDK